MKTQQEYQLYYWGPHYNMINEYNEKHSTNIQPWECVKLGNDTMEQHPVFDFPVDSYTFAVAILYDDKRREHRPVFVGDSLWNGQHWVVIEIDLYVDNLSWNPPTPKRTFNMEFTEEEMKFLAECHTAKISHISMSEHINERARSLLEARDKE